MPDEQKQVVVDELPNVADGQAVVNAVATDTQAIVDEGVGRIEQILSVQAERASTTSAVLLDESQWQVVADQLKFCSTSSMLCSFATMAVFGAVCAGHLVRGWRRG